MAYMKDALGRRLDSFVAARDVPNVYAWFDASQLAGADGTGISIWPDTSGFGLDLTQFTTAAQPTLAAANLNGKNVAKFATSQSIARATFGGSFPGPAGYAQPISLISLCKFNSSLSPSVSRGVIGSTLSNGPQMFASLPSGTAAASAGGSALAGGPNLLDGAWHILAVVFDTSSVAAYLDGYLVAASPTQSAGTAGMLGLTIGGINGGNYMTDGWIAETGVCGRLTPQQIAQLSAVLAAKWGL